MLGYSLLKSIGHLARVNSLMEGNGKPKHLAGNPKNGGLEESGLAEKQSNGKEQHVGIS